MAEVAARNANTRVFSATYGIYEIVDAILNLVVTDEYLQTYMANANQVG